LILWPASDNAQFMRLVAVIVNRFRTPDIRSCATVSNTAAKMSQGATDAATSDSQQSSSGHLLLKNAQVSQFRLFFNRYNSQKNKLVNCGS